jgi:hypothetical protein
MRDILSETLQKVEFGRSISQGPLHVFPLHGGAFAEEGIRLMADALHAGTLRIEELGYGGSVPELRVLNGDPLPVLMLEGDELIGAKQDRVLNSSVLVAAGSDLILDLYLEDNFDTDLLNEKAETLDNQIAEAERQLEKFHNNHRALREIRGLSRELREALLNSKYTMTLVWKSMIMMVPPSIGRKRGHQRGTGSIRILV